MAHHNMVIVMLDCHLDLNQVLRIVEALANPVQVVDIGPRNRRVIYRNKLFFEQTIHRYDDLHYKEHFRMTRGTFKVLLQNSVHARPNIARNTVVPLEKKVLFMMWILSKPESFLACSGRFGLTRSTAYCIFEEILAVLVNILPNHIVWPINYLPSVNVCIQVFEEHSRGFPGVIGAINGCHIKIRQPPHNVIDYYNRNKYHSIILQGISDHTMKFNDIFVRSPGRMHYARVFRNSPIYNKIINQDIALIPPNSHLIGDSAYPLMLNVMTPHHDNGHLNNREIIFNTKLCSIRSIIEQAFGRLKGKFRRLKDLEVQTRGVGVKMIAAACVLHNIILDNEQYDWVFDYKEEIQEEIDNEYHPRENRAKAVIKRLEIMNNL